MPKLSMMLWFLLCIPVGGWADDFSYRNDGFLNEPLEIPGESSINNVRAVDPSIFGDSFDDNSVHSETTTTNTAVVSDEAPEVSRRPTLRRLPAVPSEPIDTSIPVTGGKTTTFTNTSAKDRAAPIFPKIQNVMQICGEGCDAAWAHCYRSGTPNSCHATGDAMDLHGLICNGVKQGPTSAVFRRVVACIRRQKYDGVLWRALHMERTKMTSRDCSNASPTNKQTICHWDHVHLSVGCWRKDSSGRVRKKY